MINQRKIIFRADGNPTIGLGHFIRTLALAEMLNDDFYCIYATQSPTDYQIKEIESVCLERIDLPANETHFNVFLDLLKGDEIVVLDNYYFTTEYQRSIKAKGCILICIDDMHDKHFVADLIINHAEGLNESQYSAERYTTFCLGYKFALLRQEYLKDISTATPKQYSFLIMMGGADPLNLTAKIISLIEPLQFSLPAAVVVGAGYRNDHLFNQFKNIEFFKGIESSKVFQLMSTSRFGILPASTVAIEACATRIPFICGYYIANQKEIYNGIKSNNMAFCIGNYLNVNHHDFTTAIRELSRQDISEKIIQNQKSLLDKNSKKRYIKIFNTLCKSE
jgi:UDP-2,4-diacetamido-2,4,6-trideoxy-beta-L-altropyranose hydrolase